MPRPLFISISRGLLALAFFALPWVAGELYLRERYIFLSQMGTLKTQLKQNFNGSAVVIGDCTVAPMEFITTTTLAEKINIIGFGGSSIREWYYLIRNNLENLSNAKHVIIATSHPFRFRYGFHTYTSFLPYLMKWSDIYEYAVVEERIYTAEMLRFYFAKTLETYATSQTLRYSFFDSLFPNFPAWHQMRIKMTNQNQVANSWKAQPTNRTDTALNPKDNNEEEYIHRLAQLNRALGGRIVLVINARSKRMVNANYLKEREVFLSDCKKLEFKCLIMTDAMPDSHYDLSGDGLHLDTPTAVAAYWSKVEREIAQLTQ